MSLSTRSKSLDRDEIGRQIEHLLSALEDLRDDASDESQKALRSLRGRAERLWHEHRLDDTYRDLYRRGRQAGLAARDCVREHPTSTVLLGVGVAALVGWLVWRR